MACPEQCHLTEMVLTGGRGMHCGAQRGEAVLVNEECLAVIWTGPPFSLETECYQSLSLSLQLICPVFLLFKNVGMIECILFSDNFFGL